MNDSCAVRCPGVRVSRVRCRIVPLSGGRVVGLSGVRLSGCPVVRWTGCPVACGKTGVCVQNAKLRRFHSLCLHFGFSVFVFLHCLLVLLFAWLCGCFRVVKAPPSCTNTEASPASANNTSGGCWLLVVGCWLFVCLIAVCVERASGNRAKLATYVREMHLRRYILTLGLNLVYTWSQFGLIMKSGLNLVSTWSQHEKCSQLGLNMVSAWSQLVLNLKSGLSLVSTCSQLEKWSQLGLNVKSGLNMVSTWSQHEKWSQHGLNTKTNFSTWSQLGLNMTFFIEKQRKTQLACCLGSRIRNLYHVSCGAVFNTTTMLTLNTTRRHDDKLMFNLSSC